MPDALLEPFLAALPARRRAQGEGEADALAGTLAALWERARQAWPSLRVAPDTFMRYLAERLPDAPLLDALATVQSQDLFLACACSHTDAAALKEFDRLHLTRVREFIAGVDNSPAFADEVTQALREKLFVGPKAKMSEYTGRGALGGWVRIAAVRTALNLRQKRTAEDPPELEDLLAAGADPELDAIRRQAADEVASALRGAIAGLSTDDRTLLKLHHVDGLNIDQLAPLFTAHRSTVARWLVQAREKVLDETYRGLGERLGGHASELHSLLRLARSQLDVSIQRLLRDKSR